jgi:hypothetical protein
MGCFANERKRSGFSGCCASTTPGPRGTLRDKREREREKIGGKD